MLRERGVGPSVIQQERPRGRLIWSPAVTTPDRSCQTRICGLYERLTTRAGNGAVARVLFDALMNHVRRPFDKGEAVGSDAMFGLA